MDLVKDLKTNISLDDLQSDLSIDLNDDLSIDLNEDLSIDLGDTELESTIDEKSISIDEAKRLYDIVKLDLKSYLCFNMAIDDNMSKRDAHRCNEISKEEREFERSYMDEDEYDTKKLNYLSEMVKMVENFQEATFEELYLFADGLSRKTADGLKSKLDSFTDRVDNQQKLSPEELESVKVFFRYKLKMAEISEKNLIREAKVVSIDVKDVYQTIKFNELEKVNAVYTASNLTILKDENSEESNIIKMDCKLAFSPTDIDLREYKEEISIEVDLSKERNRMSSIRIIDSNLNSAYLSRLSEELTIEEASIIKERSFIRKPFIYFLEDIAVIFSNADMYDVFYIEKEMFLQDAFMNISDKKDIFYYRIDLSSENYSQISNLKNKDSIKIYKTYTNEELNRMLNEKASINYLEAQVGEDLLIRELILSTMKELGESDLMDAFFKDKYKFLMIYLRKSLEMIYFNYNFMEVEQRTYFVDDNSFIFKIFGKIDLTEFDLVQFLSGSKPFNSKDLNLAFFAKEHKIEGKSKDEKEEYIYEMEERLNNIRKLNIPKILGYSYENSLGGPFKGTYLREVVVYYANKLLKEMNCKKTMLDQDMKEAILSLFDRIGVNIDNKEFRIVYSIESNGNPTTEIEKLLEKLNIPSHGVKNKISYKKLDAVPFKGNFVYSAFNPISLIYQVSEGESLEVILSVSLLDRLITKQFVEKINNGLDINRLISMFERELDSIKAYNDLIEKNTLMKNDIESIISALIDLSNVSNESGIRKIILKNIDITITSGIKSSSMLRLERELNGYKYNEDSNEFKELFQLASDITLSSSFSPIIKPSDEQVNIFNTKLEEYKSKLKKVLNHSEENMFRENNLKYKAYLSTGDANYLNNIDRDYVSAELLMKDRTKPGEVSGEFSFQALKNEYHLNEVVKDFLNGDELDYAELYIYLERMDPNFYDSLPKTVVNYINSMKVLVNKEILEKYPNLKENTRFEFNYEYI